MGRLHEVLYSSTDEPCVPFQRRIALHTRTEGLSFYASREMVVQAGADTLKEGSGAAPTCRRRRPQG